MTTYERPSIDSPVFRDHAGNLAEYGHRWGMDGPPEDAYSVDTHPERFQPLHTIAEALLAHLTATFDVEVFDDPSAAGDLLRAPINVVRAVRLTPARDEAAPLTLVFTSYPGVHMHAGELRDSSFPSCACDACDDSWDTVADDMEEFVMAVAQGRFWERIGGGRRPWVESGHRSEDAATSERIEKSDLPGTRLQRARKALAKLPNGWQPWPSRR